jgi:hypothetical protein
MSDEEMDDDRMSDEEVQKTMRFILNQQAQFSTNIQRLEESHSQAVERIGRLEGAVVGLVGLLERLTQAQERTVTQVQLLADAAGTIAAAQTHTDGRVGTLIEIIQRHFGERHDGDTQG